MTCSELEGLLHPYLDGEFGATERDDVERHLASCQACTARAQAAQALQTVLRARVAQLAAGAPEALRTRVQAGFSQERRRAQVRWWTQRATAVACVAALA